MVEGPDEMEIGSEISGRMKREMVEGCWEAGKKRKRRDRRADKMSEMQAVEMTGCGDGWQRVATTQGT